MTRIWVICLLLAWGGCQAAPPATDARVRYVPGADFRKASCYDASSVVGDTLGRVGVLRGQADFYDFIKAFESRYDECRGESAYVSDYLDVLKMAGWSGTYNRVLADFQTRFSESEHSVPFPDSAVVSP